MGKYAVAVRLRTRLCTRCGRLDQARREYEDHAVYGYDHFVHLVRFEQRWAGSTHDSPASAAVPGSESLRYFLAVVAVASLMAWAIFILFCSM
jgi:hypothetical protein